MFHGGVVTVYVSDMDRAVRFYTDALGFKLVERYGNNWASIDGGPGLAIGLHPATAEIAAGRQGSIAIGLYLERPIDQSVVDLKKRGVQFTGPVLDDTALRLAYFADPDGNPFYLAEMKAAYR